MSIAFVAPSFTGEPTVGILNISTEMNKSAGGGGKVVSQTSSLCFLD